MSRTISDLREIIFQTMEQLKAGTMDVDRAKQIANLGQVIVNSAVAETRFIKEKGGGTNFISDNQTIPKEDFKQIIRPEAPLTTQEKTLRKYGA
jgi:hypothetical protein